MSTEREPVEAKPARKPREARPERMSRLSRLPVFLALEGKRVVLVGNGQAAAWKLELLEAAGARVEVYAVDGWMADDLRGATVAIGAFDDDDDGASAFASAPAPPAYR